MFKESFLFRPSYKYGHLKRNFDSFVEPTSKKTSRTSLSLFLPGFAKITAVVVWHTLFSSYNSQTISGKQKYALSAIEIFFACA